MYPLPVLDGFLTSSTKSKYELFEQTNGEGTNVFVVEETCKCCKFRCIMVFILMLVKIRIKRRMTPTSRQTISLLSVEQSRRKICSPLVWISRSLSLLGVSGPDRFVLQLGEMGVPFVIFWTDSDSIDFWSIVLAC